MRLFSRHWALAPLLPLLLGCGATTPGDGAASAPDATSAAAPEPAANADADAEADPVMVPDPLRDEVATGYVELVLALGQHDEDYVDAYYGPAALRQEVEAQALTLAAIEARGTALLARLDAAPPADEEMVGLRHAYLGKQLAALLARARMLGGARLTFDEESAALYDTVAPTHSEDHFTSVLGELEALLAREGYTEGALIERYEAFKAGFAIPADRLDAVFRRAIDACRERTVAHIPLPPEESFVVEYVTDKNWSGYNWYQGGFHSLIQVNTDFPIYIDCAIDLACHEGYPGHHVYNLLLEKSLVRDRGWPEFQVYPLFSPQSLIAEGSANFGIEMAFPGEERLRFDREVLFPLAGLDPERAAVYHEALALVKKLSYVDNEAARRYLDGELDAEATADWLARYAARTRERAAQRVGFFDQYRSYVINYNLGRDLVRAYVEGQGGTVDNPAQRWAIFTDLLSSPRLPSGLR